MFRRTLLLAVPGSVLAACDATGSVTPVEIVTEAQAFASGLAGALPALVAAYPSLIPPATYATILADLAQAKAAAATLVATLPATSSAFTVQNVLGYVNAALNLIASPPINGLIPSPYNVAFGAAAFLAPLLESFVTANLPVTAAVSTETMATRGKLRALAPSITTAAQAVLTLQGYAK